MSPLLTLNTFDRAICGFLIGLGVQCHPHRKATRRIVSNYLDAGRPKSKIKNSGGKGVLLLHVIVFVPA